VASCPSHVEAEKVLVILGVIVLAAVCFAMLQRPNEPKYNGRYLSEWMTLYRNAFNDADRTWRSEDPS
jgi:hypothetical protein